LGSENDAGEVEHARAGSGESLRPIVDGKDLGPAALSGWGAETVEGTRGAPGGAGGFFLKNVVIFFQFQQGRAFVLALFRLLVLRKVCVASSPHFDDGITLGAWQRAIEIESVPP
jgi:hypothetical protein